MIARQTRDNGFMGVKNVHKVVIQHPYDRVKMLNFTYKKNAEFPPTRS